jgi:alkylation response protein AidB-like acyl-CoA dehydrogenase
VKPFCSGAGLVDRALVTATPDGDAAGPVLVDVDLRGPGRRCGTIAVDGDVWRASAFAATGTGTVTFRSAPVGEQQVIGPVGWYLTRPGFWNGACGPAACWAGGATHLAETAVSHLLRSDDELSLAAAGALTALAFQCRAVLEAAGRAIDADPHDATAAQIRALAVRHSIERSCTEVIDRAGRALGPRALAFDPSFARQYSELTLYIRQCHGERDLRALGAALRPAPGAPSGGERR